MDQIINEIFSNVTYGILQPVQDGLFGMLPVIIRVAVIFGFIALIFGFNSMQRGSKIAFIVGLIVIAYLAPYIPEVVNTALGLGGDIPTVPQAADVVAGAPAPSPGTLSELTA